MPIPGRSDGEGPAGRADSPRGFTGEDYLGWCDSGRRFGSANGNRTRISALKGPERNRVFIGFLAAFSNPCIHIALIAEGSVSYAGIVLSGAYVKSKLRSKDCDRSCRDRNFIGEPRGLRVLVRFDVIWLSPFNHCQARYQGASNNNRADFP